jgi:hypothetical protein
MPVVLTPFPYIAMHVVKAKSIGSFQLVYQSCFFSVFSLRLLSIGARPSFLFPVRATIISQVGVHGFTKVERGRGFGSTSIFPFGFSGQSVLAIGMYRQPVAKLYGVIPGDFLDRVAITLEV